MAFTYIPEYSLTAGTNTDVAGISCAEGWPAGNINACLRAQLAQEKQELAYLDTVASAATVDITASGAFTVSGTTTITAFTVVAGSRRRLIFSGALTLTHNATSLILPGGANIVTAAGDCLDLVAHATNQVTVTQFTPKSGVGAVGGTTATAGLVLTANGSGTAPTWQSISTGYAAKTAGYTVIATDNGDTINWTTAGVTAALTAAATLGSGFTVTLINTAASGVVTINPDGTETLDGLTTRVLSPGDRVRIVCDGSNWFTIDGDYSFSTAEITITANTTDTSAHGQGKVPYRVESFLKCTDAGGDMGWAQNQVIRFSEDLHNIGAAGVTVGFDATNIITVFNVSSTGPFYVQNASTRASGAITASKWKIINRAYFK